MKTGFGVRAAVILIGFTAAVAQIVLLRELMVVFSGNEVSIGLMLAAWLLWTAIGSSLAGRSVARVRKPRRWMAGTEGLLAFVLPATVLAVRTARSALVTTPGEILGPGTMLIVSLTALSLFCLLSGALFAAGSRLYGAEAGVSAGSATSSVYLWEALGSSAGGLAAGLLLVRHLGSVEIAVLLALLNLLAAGGLTIARPLFRSVAMGLLGLTVLVVASGAISKVEMISQARAWRGFPLIATRNSVYGSLAVTGSEGNRSVYENGTVLFTAPDPAAAEEAVHYALLEHPAPRNGLLIGGGLNGSITQALRHPGLERIEYVELDPAILSLARDYFPNEWAPIRADPRVRVHVADGRLFLKNTASTFDVILVNLPDPQTAQLNRFYTVEFFREAARRLTPTGVLSLRLTASENYISPERAEFLRSMHETLRAVFPQVRVIPGESVHFFAARQAGVLARDVSEILSRLRARRLATNYVSESFIPFRMAPDRMRELEAQIRPRPDTPVNQDFAPIAYYFDVALWSSRFHPDYRRLFHVAAGVDFGTVAAMVGAVLAALLVCSRLLMRKEQKIPMTAAGCTMAMGFTLIGLEILLMLAFQAVYGYVYQQLALLIAAFMAGMALGSALALRSPNTRGVRTLAGLQLLAAAAPLVLYGVFELAARITSAGGLFLLSQVVFPGLALLSGLLGGYEFPIASRVFFASGSPRKLGTLYALDLAGSCLGALLFSLYLVPVFGFFRTALLTAMVSVAPVVLAMMPVSVADRREPGTAPAAGH